MAPSKKPDRPTSFTNAKLYDPCPHPFPDCLSDKLPTESTCPSCIVTRCTAAIKEAQEDYAVRGGVFMMRITAELEKKPPWHAYIAQKWRVAKVGLINAVTLFEDLVKEGKIQGEDENRIKEALEIWERQKERGWKVPGHVYYGDEHEMTEEEKETCRLMIELLRRNVEKLIREMDNEKGQTEGPESEGTLRVGLSLPTPPPELPSKSLPEELTEPNTPQPLGPSPPGSITSTPPTSILKRKSTFPSPSTSTSSALRRKRVRFRDFASSDPSPSPSLSPRRKRVRFREFVTVSSFQHSITHPSPFDLLSKPISSKPTVQPHGPNTSAEGKVRRKRAFHRTSSGYLPGAWASPAFYKKANTSFYKLSGRAAEEAAEREEREMREEAEVAEKLKVVWGAWVARWWVRNVVLSVGFQDLQQERGGDGSEVGSSNH
ncbi:hypothetical protein BU26DRAFT_576981 [Trematosphaeria pertusa]|uniref:Uncharacterized protein n=1 Tax=Trematosphaeria pertusa TaxID=390896 RepID=A0A6A6IBM5_9PLEO|nr:uncharacterized protein BU26DRAFT_576981 [Trematosphaeria pertusa]KAF2246893.1 hypothetical protein BU26DRAFT_576981 [Trematosphaeria pertusa]